MGSTEVRSLDSLKHLHDSLLTLRGDWEEVLGQLRLGSERVREHFASHWPAYWSKQTQRAEVRLQQALDNLSRLRGSDPAQRYPTTEAQQRVNVARRRLVHCQEMQVRAKRLAVVVDEACRRLAGPLAELGQQVDVNLPRAAVELAAMIDHLSRYAETQAGSLPPRPGLADSATETPPGSPGDAVSGAAAAEPSAAGDKARTRPGASGEPPASGAEKRTGGA